MNSKDFGWALIMFALVGLFLLSPIYQASCDMVYKAIVK